LGGLVVVEEERMAGADIVQERGGLGREEGVGGW
jgi:hypothetical protein